DIFSIETANIVDSLPDNIKEKAQAYILKKYHYFEELKNKDMRRNMEFLTRAFLQKDYRDLKNSISNANYVSKINSLFKQVNPKVTYNFQTVLDLAKTIQENLVQTTLKSNESLYIYGSLPNGKANLSISDIDIHFHSNANKRNKDSLMEWQILARDPELKEFRNKFELDKIRERGQSNLESFIETEDKLAVQIGREEFERGSLLGSIADDSDFFSPTNLGVYNSILLEVFNNKIKIHIIDIFSKDKIITTLDI
uniref:hypothetical protein n=1 Tax=Halobacteriovorax sp. TaxID=2020862 RepID=UPI0035681937